MTKPFLRVVAGICLLSAVLAGCSSRTQRLDAKSAPALTVPDTPAAAEKPQTDEPSTELPAPPEQSDTFVRVQDYMPDLAVELRYATENNFTGQVIYTYSDAYLRYGTAEKLARAHIALKKQGYGLKIWDAFRTAAAQDTLWAVYPDGNYVANPKNGYSGHVRGDTVDVTLYSLAGEEVEMPSDFDDFSARADLDYSDVSDLAGNHARLLQRAMEDAGFTGYDKEWWHFSDTDRHEPALDFVPPTTEGDVQSRKE